MYTLALIAATLLPAQKAIDPFIKMSGPSQRPLGRSIIIKVAFSGSDPKIVCSPQNENWFPVNLITESGYAIIFDPDKAGSYTFSGAVNGNDKTAVASFTVNVTGSDPIPPNPNPIPVPPIPTPPDPIPVPPDPLAKKLQDAYATDLASGAGDKTQRILFLNAYKQGVANYIDNQNLKNYSDLFRAQKQLNESTIPQGRCPNLRHTIAEFIGSQIGTNQALPIDRAKARDVWNKVITALNQVSP